MDEGGGHRHVALRHGELVVGYRDVLVAGFHGPAGEAVTRFRGGGQRYRGIGISLCGSSDGTVLGLGDGDVVLGAAHD